MISHINVTETAFPHRNVLFIMQLGLLWDESKSAEFVKPCLEWQDDTRIQLLADMKGAFANYQDANLYNFMEDYFGPNANRLMKVKAKYDPENVFQFKQSIPT